MTNAGKECVRIGIMPTILGASCAQLTRSLREQDPFVASSFQSAPENELIASLRDGAIDCAVILCNEPPAHDELRAAIIQHRPLGVVAARSHPLAGRLHINPSKLKGETLL